MKHTARFKSVLIVPDRRRKPDTITFDVENARDHVLSISPGNFFINRSWISSFLISLMAIIPLAALVYGVITMGLSLDVNRALPWFILSCVVAFITLLALVGTPASVRRLKWDLVVKERGAGNWKIIEDTDWENFTRMIRLAEERKKRVKEELEKEMAKGPSWPAR
ncbi:MAG TPA: hypothetical protein VLM75_06735 [Spirochaetota bacterium]|nr:hypothetical protein [Spirochaetota bacterium]